MVGVLEPEEPAKYSMQRPSLRAAVGIEPKRTMEDPDAR